MPSKKEKKEGRKALSELGVQPTPLGKVPKDSGTLVDKMAAAAATQPWGVDSGGAREHVLAAGGGKLATKVLHDTWHG